MPIDYKEYPDNWKQISQRIRSERAGNACEQCGLVNGQIIVRNKNGSYRKICGTEYDMIHSKVRNGYSHSGALKRLGFTRIVLTVAHLNHIKSDCREENLKALCQACHLKLDLPQHIFNRKYGRKARENNLSLFAVSHGETK